VEADGKILLHGEEHADVQALDATPAGSIDLSGILETTPLATISLALEDAEGKPISRYRREVFLEAWQR
jgi:hypothetical protein